MKYSQSKSHGDKNNRAMQVSSFAFLRSCFLKCRFHICSKSSPLVIETKLETLAQEIQNCTLYEMWIYYIINPKVLKG